MGSLVEAATALAAGPWAVMAAAALPTFISAIWVGYKWWAERHDKNEQADLSVEDRRMVALEQERQSLSAGQQSLFTTVRDENIRVNGELAAMRRDRDRGWGLFYLMQARAVDLLHKLQNAQQEVNSHRVQAGMPERAWPVELPLPTDYNEAAS